MNIFLLSFELLAIFFAFTSCCQISASDNNKPNRYIDRWRRLHGRSRGGPGINLTKCQTGGNNEDTEIYDDDSNGLVSPLRSFFTWEAIIHGPTGVASSNERSGPFQLRMEKALRWPNPRRMFKGSEPRSSRLRQGEQERNDRLRKEEEKLVVETSRQFVNTWSDFLCQGSISFGILRCMKEKGSEKKKSLKLRWKRRNKTKTQRGGTGDDSTDASGTTSSSSSLLARFVPLPVKLLEFGKTVEPSLSSADNCDDDESKQNGLVILGSWDIPLQGGALILEDDQLHHQNSTSSSTGGDCYRGRLAFTISKISRLSDENQTDNSVESCPNRYQIMTGIRDYRPWLAGGGYKPERKENVPNDSIWDALKANREKTTRRICHGFYLSTQSIVHAYVMWRFHHAWREQIESAVGQMRQQRLK